MQTTSEDTLKLAQRVIDGRPPWPDEAAFMLDMRNLSRALIDLHERMGKIAELAEVSDSNGFPYRGLRSILALTKGTK